MQRLEHLVRTFRHETEKQIVRASAIGVEQVAGMCERPGPNHGLQATLPSLILKADVRVEFIDVADDVE